MADDAKASSQEPNRAEVAANMLDLAFNSPIPKLYFNGFSMAAGTSDLTLVLQLNDRPIGVLHTSYPIAKELGEKLTEGVAKIEKIAGVPYSTNEEMRQKAQKIQEGSKK